MMMASEYLTTTVLINSASILLLSFLLRSLMKRLQKSQFKLPCVNDRRKLELSYANVKKRFQTDAASLLQRGFEQVSITRATNCLVRCSYID